MNKTTTDRRAHPTRTRAERFFLGSRNLNPSSPAGPHFTALPRKRMLAPHPCTVHTTPCVVHPCIGGRSHPVVCRGVGGRGRGRQTSQSALQAHWLPASPRATRCLGADGVSAARPGACGSRVTASRYALGAEGVGATRPSAHMCSLTVPVCLTHPKLRTRRARRGGVRAMRPIPGVSHAPNPAGFEPRLALCRNSGPCPLCAPSTYNTAYTCI